MSKPTHGSIQESLEVVWEAIHGWCDNVCGTESDTIDKDAEANTKLAMNLIMDELGYTYDESGVIIPKQSTSTFSVEGEL